MSAISKIALKSPEIIEKIKTATHEKQILELLSANDIEIEHKIIAEDVLSPEIKPARENDTLEEIAKRLILEQKSALPVLTEDGIYDMMTSSSGTAIHMLELATKMLKR